MQSNDNQENAALLLFSSTSPLAVLKAIAASVGILEIKRMHERSLIVGSLHGMSVAVNKQYCNSSHQSSRDRELAAGIASGQEQTYPTSEALA